MADGTFRVIEALQAMFVLTDEQPFHVLFLKVLRKVKVDDGLITDEAPVHSRLPPDEVVSPDVIFKVFFVARVHVGSVTRR